MQAAGLQMLLESWGAQAVTGLSLSEAEEKLARLDRAPDIAIVDFRLGDGLSGIEAVGALRKAVGQDFAAVIHTGDTDPEVARLAADHGCQLLLKPYTSERMREVLEQALQSAGA